MNKKCLLYIVLFLCFGIVAQAENTITISSVEGAPGDEVTVSVSLTNTDAVSSLQVSIPLDENLTLVSGSGQKSERCTSSHSVIVGVKEGVLNVFVYSVSMAELTGNDGVVASFKVKLGNQPATISMTPSNMVLTSSSGQQLDASATAGSVTIRCAKAQYSSTEVDFGRVPIRDTYSRTVTVTNVGNADLTITGLTFSDVNVFSSTTMASLPLTIVPGGSAQLNITYKPAERGNITRTLKVTCNSVSKLNTITLKAQPFAVNELHIQPASGNSDEEVTVSMTMNNMDAIVGWQVEFTLPEQLEYVANSFVLSDRHQDHQSVASLNGNVLRIFAFSNYDTALTGDDGEIGSFKVKLVGRNGVKLTPTNTVLTATINGVIDNVVSAVYGGQITIKSPRINCNSTLDFGAVSVTEPCEKTFTIRNNGNAPLTISRVTFNNEHMSIKEELPIVVANGGNSNLTVVYNSVEQTSFEGTMNIYSNDPDLRLKTVSVKGSRFAPNYMSVSAADVFPKENLSIDIALNTYDAIVGLQFDVVYPGQYYSTFENNYTLEPRAAGMTATVRQIDTNTLRFFCFFLSDTGIAPGEGKIMSLLLNPKTDGVPVGSYTIKLKDIKFSTANMTEKYAGTDTQCTFVVKSDAATNLIAKSYTREYGEANPTFEFTVEGEAISGVPEIICEATALSPAGEYPIIIKPGTVTGGDIAYVNGVLTITKAPLTIKAGTYTRKQGEENPEFTLTYEGFKNDETAEVLTTKPNVTCKATKASKVGTYDVVVSGAEAENYDITYVNGVLTVEFIVGDANGDGKVTITDAVAIVNFILGNPSDNFNKAAANVNDDYDDDGNPKITITDAVGVVNIILNNGGSSAPKMEIPEVEADDEEAVEPE